MYSKQHTLNSGNLIFLISVLRTLEAGKITPDIVQRMLNSENIDKAIQSLNGTLYQDFFSQLGRTDIEALIKWRRASFLDLVEKHAPDQNLLKILKLPYEVHNLKALIKSKIFDVPVSESLSPFAITDTEELKIIMDDEAYSKLDPAESEIIVETIETYYRYKKAIIIDLILDSFLYKQMLSIGHDLRNPFITLIITTIIDSINIQTLSRALNAIEFLPVKSRIFIPGGRISPEDLKHAFESEETAHALLLEAGYFDFLKAYLEKAENPFALERECDSFLFRELSSADFEIDGLNPIFAYAYKMDIELKILGIVLSAKKNNISTSFIKQRIPII